MNSASGMNLAVAKQRLSKGVLLQRELNILELFAKKQFVYQDRMVKNELHNFEVCILKYNELKKQFDYS